MILRSHAEICTHDIDVSPFEAALAPSPSKRCFESTNQACPLSSACHELEGGKVDFIIQVYALSIVTLMSYLEHVLLILSLYWNCQKSRLNVERSNQKEHIAIGKLQTAAANFWIRATGRANSGLGRSFQDPNAGPVSDQFSTRSAWEWGLYATSPNLKIT